MSRFTTTTAVYPFRAADTGLWTWALAEPLVWEVRDASGAVTGEIVVPVDFLTDLGSIPPLLRWLFNPADPQCAKAYIGHDWLLHQWGPGRQVEAAGVMHQMLQALAVKEWRRRAQVWGVLAAIDRW